MGMSSEDAKKIMAGDLLIPDELWNRTERLHKLEIPTEVLSVKKASCQTGILLLVRCTSGMERWLSAGWFLTPNAELRGRPLADGPA
jgi:hypothetical protein